MMARRWAFVLGLAGLVPLAAGCGGRGGVETAVKASTTPQPVPVTVAPLEHREVERTVEVVGTLNGWERVAVGSKRYGRVLKVFHDMGDRVKPGEPLAVLDPVDADLSVRQSERQLQAELAKIGLKELPEGEFDVSTVPAVVQARLQLERVRLNLNRERTLSRRGAGTAQDLQNAENDEQIGEAAVANAVLSAQATLAHARALRVSVDVARQSRADMEIRAPILSQPPGVTTPLTFAVSKRSVTEGQMIREGETVAELVVEDPLRLWANVPERFGAEVRVGQPVRVSVASHPTPFEGKVTRINPAVDAVSRTFQVEVAVPNHAAMLHPGGFAKASIQVESNARAAVVPLETIVRFAGVTKLFVVEGEKARAINVETGLEGAGWVEVVGKLPESAQVVTTGQTQLADGTPVVVREPVANEAAAPEPKPAGPSG
jgi:RND family efflux transporter MFP subunit